MEDPQTLASLFEGRLPPDWRISVLPGRQLRLEPGSDVLIALNPPTGLGALITVEARSRMEARSATAVVNDMRASGSVPTMLVTSFVPPRAQEILRSEGVGYADLTGNFYLALSEPALFIRDRGADRDPWQEPRPIRSLKGPIGGRVIRGLCQFRPPYAINELARRISTPESSVSRIVSLADKEGLVQRSRAGSVVEVDWPNLIRTWVRDYSVLRTNRLRHYLDPRGLGAIDKRLVTLDELAGQFTDGRCDYAVTGSLAGNQIAPYAPPATGMIYVGNVRVAADSLELRETDRGTNVILLEPYDNTLLREPRPRGVFRRCAPLPQVVADLLTSGGRSPQEGEELLSWMKDNEDDWRG